MINFWALSKEFLRLVPVCFVHKGAEESHLKGQNARVLLQQQESRTRSSKRQVLFPAIGSLVPPSWPSKVTEESETNKIIANEVSESAFNSKSTTSIQ